MIRRGGHKLSFARGVGVCQLRRSPVAIAVLFSGIGVRPELRTYQGRLLQLPRLGFGRGGGCFSLWQNERIANARARRK